MAGSVKRGVGIALVALLTLTGCDSTQEKNARAELRAKRELASRELPKVARPSTDVRVERTGIVRGKRPGSAAIVVDLRSTASKPLTDVPIVVGVRGRDGRGRVLNAKRHLNWFQTHVPAIPADGTVTWVFKGARGVKAGDRPFAKVGRPASPALSGAVSLPSIAVEAVPVDKVATSGAKQPSGKRSKKPRSEKARVLVENRSEVPQYDLQVYALARRGGRYVAAGKAEIEHLGTDQRVTVAIPLTGSAAKRPLRAHAIPTIFE